MHFAFIPYGIKNFVDFIIEDFNHRYLPLRIYKEGEQDKFLLMQLQIRILPFGIYELIFPKEFKDEILSALIPNTDNEYYSRLQKKVLSINPLGILRRFLHLEPILEFKKIPHPNFPIPEYTKFVSIIPIGIREDGEITEIEGEFKDWKHEAI